MDEKRSSFWQRHFAGPSFLTIGAGVLFVTLFFFSCEADSTDGVDNQTVEVTDDYQPLGHLFMSGFDLGRGHILIEPCF